MDKDAASASIEGSSVLFDASSFIPLDPTQEPIFPPALKVLLIMDFIIQKSIKLIALTCLFILYFKFTHACISAARSS